MKNNFILILALILIMSCNKKRQNDNIVHFMNDTSISSVDGKPLDSLSFYFPKKLFFDTTRYITYANDTFELKHYQNIDTLIKYRELIKEKTHILDSLKIEDVSFFAKTWSFALFKMKEPILYNYYLHKDVYRLIIDQSFSKFFIIDIENNNDSIIITTKGLNRHIRYPFIICASSNDIIFRPPGVKKLPQKEIDRIHHRNDSIAKKYNNTNYYIDTLICKKISKQQWIELQNKLEKIKFWNSAPKTCGGCMQIDGSRWIIEGHSEIGYQIHEILSPFDKNDNQDNYSDLFKFIINISGLKADSISFY